MSSCYPVCDAASARNLRFLRISRFHSQKVCMARCPVAVPSVFFCTPGMCLPPCWTVFRDAWHTMLLNLCSIPLTVLQKLSSSRKAGYTIKHDSSLRTQGSGYHVQFKLALLLRGQQDRRLDERPMTPGTYLGECKGPY